MEVFPGVYRFRLPLPNEELEHINSYLVRGSEGSLLIDPGWDAPASFDELCRQIREDGLRVEDIDRVVVTHIHPDHFGLAGRVKRLTGARVMVHEVEAEQVGTRYVDVDYLLKGIASWLAENGVKGDDLPTLPGVSLPVREFVVNTGVDIAIRDGDVISVYPLQLRALWTPGHSPGHICLYETGRKLLFSGDHVLPDITPHVGSHPLSGESPLADFIASQRRLVDLDVELVLPAHGNAFADLRTRAEQLMHHHEEREREILGVLDDRPRTAYDVATRITWMKDRGGRPYRELPGLDRRLAVMEAVAHLQLLLEKGKVRRLRSDNLIMYMSAAAGESR